MSFSNTSQAAEHPGRAGAASFAHLSPRWRQAILLIIAALFGMSMASWIAGGAWYLLLSLFLGLPLLVMLIRYPLVVLMIWFLVFPYVIGSHDLRPVYWVVHRLLIPGTLGLVVLYRLWRDRRLLLRFGIPELSMLIFFLLGIFNIVVLVREPLLALVFFYDRFFVPFCAYWLIRQVAPTSTDIKRLLPIAVVTLIAQVGASLLTWFRPDTVPAYWLHEPGRTAGTLGDPAIYTSTLMFLALLLLQYDVNCERRWLRIPLLLCFWLAFFGVFFSFSRGNWLAGAIVFLALSFLYPRRMIHACFIGILVLTFAGSFLQRESRWAAERLMARESAESRVPQVFASLRMIEERPLFGWGYNNYNVYVRPFTTGVGDIYYRKIHSSHNSTLTILVEMGFIGFFLAAIPTAWWLGASLKRFRRLSPSGFWSHKLLAVVWLSVAYTLIVSCFQDIVSTANPAGLTVYWMALGFIASLVDSDPQPSV